MVIAGPSGGALLFGGAPCAVRPICPFILTHRFQRPLAFLCLALSMSLVGVYVALSKPLVAAIPVFLLGWMRFGIAAVAMAGWLKSRPARGR